MNLQTQYYHLAGSAGRIQCALDLPEGEVRGIVAIAHPHPLFGGTMDNKVVHTLVRSFLALGYAAARLNFRGVGETEGVHDNGIGETEDFGLLLADLRQRFPGQPFALAGFSFGTFVLARLNAQLSEQGDAAERLVMVGSAAGKWDIPNVPANTILIHGELDETIPLQNVFTWAGAQDLPVIVVTRADHFFHRKLQHIKNFVVELWHR